ncbi:MAG: cytochrome b [Thiohalomonadales bacterium]
MAIKNTAESYGSLAKLLHWVTALLFLGSYVSVYFRRWFTEVKTPENWIALQLHLSIGLTIAVIVVLRIFWRIMNRLPDHEPGTDIEHLAAKSGHYTLYAVMIIMTVTGYIATGTNTDYFLMFEIPKFETTQLYLVTVNDWMGLTFKEFERPIDFVHKNVFGAWLVWLLIAGHVLAALYHHYIKKDRTIVKMKFDI